MRDNPALLISNKRFENRLKSIEKEYNAILLISKTNINTIYDCTGEKNYYVYVHCNTASPLNIKDNARHMFAAQEFGLKFEPFYVGKGTGDRAFDLKRNEGHNKIQQYLKKVNKEVEIVILKKDLSEGEALALESKLIDIFGLKSISNLGCLVNLDEGFCAKERRKLYPKGVPWYLNRVKLQPYKR